MCSVTRGGHDFIFSNLFPSLLFFLPFSPYPRFPCREIQPGVGKRCEFSQQGLAPGRKRIFGVFKPRDRTRLPLESNG